MITKEWLFYEIKYLIYMEEEAKAAAQEAKYALNSAEQAEGA